MSRTSVRYTKWKIFFDGVEMPWISFSVQTGRDNAGAATINLVYDSSLFFLRPETIVHIFMYDVYEESALALDKFKLWWEGKIDGVTDSRTPTTRMSVVQASGLFSIFATHKAFMSGFGPVAQTYLVTGSSLTSEIASAGFQLIDTALFGKAFSPEIQGAGAVPFRKFSEPVYSERLLNLIAYFVSHNSLLRLRSVRTNLFGKFASIPDQVLTKMVTRSIAVQYFNQSGYAVDENASIADIIGTVNQRCFYSYSSMMAPKLADTQPTGTDRYITPISDQKGSVFDIPMLFYRNDYIFLPETLYAIPPACNLIFPEFIDSAELARAFEAEPTRSLIVDDQLGSNLAIMSPETIFRYEDLKKKKAGQKLKPEEMWAINIGAEGGSSPYVTPEGVNLLSAITDDEIEKGIIPATSFPSLWLFSGLSNLFDMATEDGRDALRSYLEPFLGTAAQAIGNDQDMEQAYLYLMKSIADYTFTLSKFRRQASVTLHGHRWLVPGLPAVILLENSCYICIVLGHAFSVDPEGQETSSISIDYVRPLPSVNLEYVAAAEKVDALSSALKNVLADLRTEYDALSSRLKILGDALISAVRAYLLSQVRVSSPFGSNRLSSEEARSALQVAIDEYVRVALTVSTKPSTLQLLTPDSRFGEGGEYIKYQVGELIEAVNTAKNRVSEIEDGGGKDLPDFERASIRQKLDRAFALVDSLSAVYSESPATKTNEDTFSALSITYPFPPIFANEDLLNVESAESLYEGIIGSKKIFTELARDAAISPIPGVSGVGTEGNLLTAAKTRQAYSKFLRFVHALKKLFPVDAGAVNSAWYERSKNPDISEPVRDWEEREILRRTGLQSLNDFLNRHGLDAKLEVSVFPTQITFYVMKPVKEYKVKNADGVELTWDDTIFSKVIDEKRLVPAGEAVGVETSDEEILKLRKSVKEPFLTTKARQEFLIRYARTHFGSRAHGAT